MVNAKKDKRAKAAKKEKKHRKKANRTAITLVKPKKDGTSSSEENLWDQTIPTSDDGRPHMFDFTDGDKYLVQLWDKQTMEDQLGLLAVNRSHLLHLLQDSLGLSEHVKEKVPEPPREKVAIYQAVFLKSLSKNIHPSKGAPCRVQLHSLSAAHLNGQYAIRGQYNTDLQRWHVQLEQSSQEFHIKDENVRIVDTPNPHRGIALLPPSPTILNVIVFEILKDRLGQLLVIERSIISSWVLMLYLVYMYSPYQTWSIFCAMYLFITFQHSSECNSLRSWFAHTTQHTLCTDRSSTEHMQWKSDSYLAAALLFLMVRSSSTLLVVIYQIVVPYIMYTLEKCGTKDDKKCFNRMRIGFSWLNKFILLWYAWSVSWFSLMTVCVVIFTEISKIAFSFVLFGVAWLMTNGRKMMRHCASVVDSGDTIVALVLKFKLILFVAVLVLFLFLTWTTWEVTSWWGVPLRIVSSLTMLILFPEYSVNGASVVAAVVTKSFSVVQFGLDQLKGVLRRFDMRKEKDSDVEGYGVDYGFTEEEWAEMERQEAHQEEMGID
jgi:hypothetical protein